jgi:hypothetical protein
VGFDTTTLILLLLLGPAVFILGWFQPFVVLSALVLLLPFRDLSIRVLNAFTDIPIETVNSLSRWWFVIVLGLFAVWLVKGVRGALALKRLPRPSAPDILLVVLVVMGVIEAFVSPNRMAGFTSLRGYLQPLIVFLLARSFIPGDRKQLRSLHVGLLIVGGLIAAMAFWQYAAWTEATYKTWGYVDQYGRITGLLRELGQIGVEFIRPASTLSGPNELGSVMLILFFLALQWAIFGSGRRNRILALILSIAFLGALALTNSRSVFLGFIAASIVFAGYLGLSYRKHLPRLSRRQRILIAAGALLGVGLIWVLMKTTGLIDIVLWSIQNPQAQEHLLESLQALRDIVRTPAGVGMGMVWPKGAAVLRKAGALYHVEGALFQIAFEWGAWGFAAWMAFIGTGLFKNLRAWTRQGVPEARIQFGTAILGWVGILVVLLFLPLTQSINLMVMLWFLLGLGVGLERSPSLDKRLIEA